MKIAYITNNFKVSNNMKGIGLRSWEIANVLAEDFEVTLFIPNPLDPILNTKKNKRLLFHIMPEEIEYESGFKEYDVFILESWSNPVFLKYLYTYDKFVITDSLITPIENMLIQKVYESPNRDSEYYEILTNYKLQLSISDHVIVGSRDEMLIMLGILKALYRVNYDSYLKDPKLENLISIIPPGYSCTYNETSLFEVVEAPNMYELLWNGGIWNHYSPSPLIRALKRLKDEGIHLKLLFMYSAVNSLTATAKAAIDLSKELDLYNENIIFNDTPVYFDNRESYLVNALGIVCMYPKTAEANTTLRLRLRDVLLYKKPILTSNYGTLANLVVEHNIGVTVDVDDELSIIDGLKKLFSERVIYENNIDKIRTAYTYETTTKNLVEVINQKRHSKDKQSNSVLKLHIKDLFHELGVML